MAIAACCVAPTACYPSNVVALRDRAVATADLETRNWRPCAAADLAGYFESYAIEGEAALSLKKVYYLFASGGRYTGAALIDGDEGPQFQTLGGAWTLDAGGLSLDGAPKAICEVDEGDCLRIAVDGGSISLRRVVGS